MTQKLWWCDQASEPDNLESEVKWALGNITMHKTSGGDEIPGELFQVLEDDAVDVLHSILHSVNLENSTLATRLEKVIFFSIPKKGNTKERSNYHTIALNLTH